MHNRRVSISLLAATAIALTGCSSAAPDPVAGVPALAVDVAKVQVTERGEDPRVLTYTDATGAADDSGAASASPRTTEHTVTVADGFGQNVVATDAVDAHAPAEIPTETIKLNLSATSRPAPEAGESEIEADRRVDFELVGAEAPQTSTGVDMDSAVGFLMSWRAANQGRVSTVKLLAPDEALDATRAPVEAALLSVLNTNVVFPSEPVGHGGEWTVESRVTGDATMLRTTTYTIAELDSDHVVLNVSISERPSQESLSFDEQRAPELAGQELTVESSTTLSLGQVTVEFDQPLPVAGQINATTRVVYAGAQDNFRIVQDQAAAITYGG